jgi:hypothetical protein
VRWFLDRFKGGNRSRAPLVCYLRENGPIAYGAELFGQDPRERADAMFATGLAWFWKAAGPAAIARDWTSLTRWSLAALLADLAIEQGGARPDILVIGIDEDGHDSPEEMTDRRVAGWMRGFAAAADGPLHAVVSRPGAAGELLFVAQQPPESIRTLLQAWGIDRDKAERRSYARLHGKGLEDLIFRLKAEAT